MADNVYLVTRTGLALDGAWTSCTEQAGTVVGRLSVARDPHRASHHVADLGFYGNSRNVGGYTVPHFQVMLGGQWSENGGSYALAMGAVPSKRVPDLVTALTDRYTAGKQDGETFQQWCQRIGKKALKGIVDQFDVAPELDAERLVEHEVGRHHVAVPVGHRSLREVPLGLRLRDALVVDPDPLLGREVVDLRACGIGVAGDLPLHQAAHLLRPTPLGQEMAPGAPGPSAGVRNSSTAASSKGRGMTYFQPSGPSRPDSAQVIRIGTENVRSFP